MKLITGQSSVTTYYLYDGEPSEWGHREMDGQVGEGNRRAERERTSQKPILEYDAGGATVGDNVYGKGIDEILERVAVGSDNQWHTYFPQQNHEGSVILLTDLSGSVIERYRYDAFGAPTIYAPDWSVRSATSYDNRFLFTGREYAATYRSAYTTPAFNFYEYRARAYNPTLGRFMSEDPKLFDAGDYNLFRYCHNDPIDFTDPMGLALDTPNYWQPRWLAPPVGFSPTDSDLGRVSSYFATKSAFEQAAKQALAMAQIGVGRQPTSESSRNEQAQAALDRWAGLAYASRKEVAATMNSSGQSILGPERDRYPTKSNPGPITADTVATWHFHHLLPRTAPYKFSYPHDERMILGHPNLSHYVGVLNAPAGRFTIFAYTPETPWLHYIRLGPQPFPQPPSY